MIKCKINKEIITFGGSEIRKYKSHHHKNPIFWEEINTGAILALNEIFSDGKKLGILYCLLRWLL